MPKKPDSRPPRSTSSPRPAKSGPPGGRGPRPFGPPAGAGGDGPRGPRSRFGNGPASRGPGPGFGPGNKKFFGGKGPPRDDRSPPPERGDRAPSPREDGTTTNDLGTFIARGVRLIHEDDEVIVVDKPPGIVTADPSRAQNAAPNMKPSARVGQTLFDFVKRHVRQNSRTFRRRDRDTENPADLPGRVWVIHRLDKEASGLVVFAKTMRAFESLKAEFGSKKAHRIYLAVAEGVIGPPGFASTKQSMIEEDRGPTQRTQDRLGPPIKPAVTHYRVVATGQGRTLVQVRLETGRKNQIRIHMQELGHPLVGDARFNAGTNPIKRLGLHAAELGFTNPANKQTVRFSSPAPSTFYTCVGTEVPSTSKALDAARPSESGELTQTQREDTSWESVAQWYDHMLEDKGNDHYENVILPGTLALLNVKPAMRVLDLACGQGILCRRMQKLGVEVIGVDAAPGLIAAARKRSPQIDYRDHDARDLGSLGLKDLDAVTCVMALSNIDPIEGMLKAVFDALKPGGVLVASISHPAFRVPGESAWGWDEGKMRQFRRVDAYLTANKRAIEMQPGKAAGGQGEIKTWTFHRPIGVYVRALAEAGLVVDRLEEWCSQRAATSGPRAPEENRARLEFPLFLGIRAVKPG
jgi:RluA family pseudouridine synthase